MKFSWDRAWTDVGALWRVHGDVLLILAGLLLMVPQFASQLFFPFKPETVVDFANAETVTAYFAEYQAYIAASWPGLLVFSLVSTVGTGTILIAMLDPDRPTIGNAIGRAFRFLASLFVLNFLVSLAVYFGLLLLIVPGLYLFGRLAIATASLMANRSGNPLDALRQSFAMTRGNGWSVAFFSLFVVIVASLLASGIQAIIGIVLALVIPASSLPAVSGFLAAIVAAAVTLLALLISAATYRQLAAQHA
jgi:Uncharacterised protein family (UPF0259)